MLAPCNNTSCYCAVSCTQPNCRPKEIVPRLLLLLLLPTRQQLALFPLLRRNRLMPVCFRAQAGLSATPARVRAFALETAEAMQTPLTILMR